MLELIDKDFDAAISVQGSKRNYGAQETIWGFQSGVGWGEGVTG